MESENLLIDDNIDETSSGLKLNRKSIIKSTVLVLTVALIIILIGLITFIFFGNNHLNKNTTSISLTHRSIVMNAEFAELIETSIDHSINPCDDFYQYACGNWQRDNPTPNDTNGWSHWIKLNNDIREKLLDLLANSSIEKDPKYLQPLIKYFKGCTDINGRLANQAQNFAQIRNIINSFGGFPMIDSDWNEDNYNIEKALIQLNRFMKSKLILEIDVIEDLRNNSQHIIAISNPFSNRERYTGVYTYFDAIETENSEESDGETKTKIQILIETLKGDKISETEWNEQFIAVQAFEIAIRIIAINQNNSYDLNHYDSLKMTVKHLDKIGDINLRFIIEEVFRPENIPINDSDVILVPDFNYLKNIGSILKYSSKRIIANYIAINIALTLIKYTSPEMDELVTNANETQIPKQCLSYSEVFLPDLVGRLYMDTYFHKESLDDMKSFISSLREAFHLVLTENQWMDRTTKINSIKKLTAITEHIAFPNYSSNDAELLQYHSQYMDLSADDFLNTSVSLFNIQRIDAFRKLTEHSFPKSQWPQISGVVVNAFYVPQQNTIFFPAGIAQFPFYQHSRSLTTNLGGIGSVIGHEFTHGFDIFGRNFDKNGNLANWFTNISRQNFYERAACFVKQYDDYYYNTEVNTKISLNGLKTINENIADNGGIKISYKAFELYKQKTADILKMPADLSSFTEQQIFFLSFANLWCTNKNKNAIAYQIANDVHSVANSRVNGPLSNFDQFARAFNCPLNSKMNPIDKCLLW